MGLKKCFDQTQALSTAAGAVFLIDSTRSGIDHISVLRLLIGSAKVYLEREQF